MLKIQAILERILCKMQSKRTGKKCVYVKYIIKE